MPLINEAVEALRTVLPKLSEHAGPELTAVLERTSLDNITSGQVTEIFNRMLQDEQALKALSSGMLPTDFLERTVHAGARPFPELWGLGANIQDLSDLLNSSAAAARGIEVALDASRSRTLNKVNEALADLSRNLQQRFTIENAQARQISEQVLSFVNNAGAKITDTNINQIVSELDGMLETLARHKGISYGELNAAHQQLYNALRPHASELRQLENQLLQIRTIKSTLVARGKALNELARAAYTNNVFSEAARATDAGARAAGIINAFDKLHAAGHLLMTRDGAVPAMKLLDEAAKIMLEHDLGEGFGHELMGLLAAAPRSVIREHARGNKNLLRVIARWGREKSYARLEQLLQPGFVPSVASVRPIGIYRPPTPGATITMTLASRVSKEALLNQIYEILPAATAGGAWRPDLYYEALDRSIRGEFMHLAPNSLEARLARLGDKETDIFAGLTDFYDPANLPPHMRELVADALEYEKFGHFGVPGTIIQLNPKAVLRLLRAEGGIAVVRSGEEGGEALLRLATEEGLLPARGLPMESAKKLTHANISLEIKRPLNAYFEAVFGVDPAKLSDEDLLRKLEEHADIITKRVKNAQEAIGKLMRLATLREVGDHPATLYENIRVVERSPKGAKVTVLQPHKDIKYAAEVLTHIQAETHRLEQRLATELASANPNTETIRALTRKIEQNWVTLSDHGKDIKTITAGVLDEARQAEALDKARQIVAQHAEWSEAIKLEDARNEILTRGAEIGGTSVPRVTTVTEGLATPDAAHDNLAGAVVALARAHGGDATILRVPMNDYELGRMAVVFLSRGDSGRSRSLDLYRTYRRLVRQHAFAHSLQGKSVQRGKEALKAMRAGEAAEAAAAAKEADQLRTAARKAWEGQKLGMQGFEKRLKEIASQRSVELPFKAKPSAPAKAVSESGYVLVRAGKTSSAGNLVRGTKTSARAAKAADRSLNPRPILAALGKRLKENINTEEGLARVLFRKDRPAVSLVKHVIVIRMGRAGSHSLAYGVFPDLQGATAFILKNSSSREGVATTTGTLMRRVLRKVLDTINSDVAKGLKEGTLEEGAARGYELLQRVAAQKNLSMQQVVKNAVTDVVDAYEKTARAALQHTVSEITGEVDTAATAAADAGTALRKTINPAEAFVESTEAGSRQALTGASIVGEDVAKELAEAPPAVRDIVHGVLSMQGKTTEELAGIALGNLGKHINVPEHAIDVLEENLTKFFTDALNPQGKDITPFLACMIRGASR